MKQIALNGKYGEGKFALVDDEDFPYLSQFNWTVDSNGYVKRSLNIKINGKWKNSSILMHREVMNVT